MKSQRIIDTGLFKTVLLFSAILLLVPSNCFCNDKDAIGVLHQRFVVTRSLPRMSSDFIAHVDYELIPGDANCDGAVNVLDVIVIANYFAGNDPDPFCFENADVNGDGAINVMDIILTIDIFLGDGIGYDTVTDIDGNLYQTVIIGEQEWMAENLRVTKFNNGDPIPTGLNNDEWSANTQGAYAIYPHGDIDGLNSDTEVIEAYGKLYNWYAVDDERGLCPEGWSVPGDADWTSLINFVISEGFPNGNDINGASNALKSCRQISHPNGGDCDTSEHPRWDLDNIHSGFDEFGFSGLPGGYRWSAGSFSNVGSNGRWWSATESNAYRAWHRSINSSTGFVYFYNGDKRSGFSIRCIRDLDE